MRHYSQLTDAELLALIEECGGYRPAAEALGQNYTGAFGRHCRRVRDEAETVRDSERLTITNLPEEDPDWQNLFDRLCDYQEAVRQRDTEQFSADVEIDTDLPIGLAITSDQHLGNVGTDHRLIGRIVQTIIDTPGLYVADNGDSIDNFVAQSHETGRYEQIARPRLQKQFGAWIFQRWAGKLICNTGGQHEYFEERVSDFDSAEYFARKGGAVYLGAGGPVNLLVGEQLYHLGMWHRYRGNSIYDRTAAAKRCFREHGPFDVTITGDKHEPAISMCFEQGNWGIFVQAGTFKLSDSYARSLGYTYEDPYACVAVPLIILWPDRKEYQVFLNFNQGVEYLSFLRGD